MAVRGGMYSASKRKKELARKKKQEEKRQKRQKSTDVPSSNPEGVDEPFSSGDTPEGTE